MADGVMLKAGDPIVKTLTFTLTVGEKVARITLLLARSDARADDSIAGRARSIVLESAAADPASADAMIRPASIAPSPRVRYDAELRGVVPASICGGTYMPVNCIFTYADDHPATAFEIAADQRFVLNINDDAGCCDSGPAIIRIA